MGERNWIVEALDDIPPEMKKFVGVSETGKSFTVRMQNDVVSEVGVCGVQVGELIHFPLALIRFLNKKFPCRENSLTVTKLEEALHWDRARTEDRKARGVEGRNEA